MHLARAGNFKPLAGQRPGLELDVDLGAGLGEREVAGPETQHQVVGLEEGLAEIQVGDLQVLEAHVLAQPQALDLVEHGRVRGVVVDAVGAAGHDDAHLGDLARRQRRRVLFGVRGGVADLHRAGVRAQAVRMALVVVHVDVEGVLHRARRVVGRVVQRGEVEPVVLDLRAVAHVEAHAAEDLLDALPRQADGVQPALPARAAGQRHVQCLGLQLALQLGIGQRLAARVEGRFDGLLGLVDGGATGLLLVHAQGGHAFHQLGHAAGLAEELRLGVLQIGRRGGTGKAVAGALNQVAKVFGGGGGTHRCSGGNVF